MNASAPNTRSIDSPPHGLRVLVVEDSIDSTTVAERFLQAAGHHVLTTRNGTEALVVAESFRPQAVLIDIGLPGLDGLHVARELRKRSGNMLLIATTGRSAPEDLRRSKEAGFDHHLVKPLDFDALLSLLLTEGEGCDA